MICLSMAPRAMMWWITAVSDCGPCRQSLALAAETGAAYLDLNDPLTDENGCLKVEYCLDGIHINEDGYRAIFPLLMEQIGEPIT